MEASRLRQKAEELVKDNELLQPPSSFDHLAEFTGTPGCLTLSSELPFLRQEYPWAIDHSPICAVAAVPTSPEREVRCGRDSRRLVNSDQGFSSAETLQL